MSIIPIPGFSEPFSALSHLVAAGVFLLFGCRLVKYTKHMPVRVITVSIYVFSVVFLLSMSGVFHLLEPGSPERAVLQRLDHAGIFVLIAGTFTPIHAILFSGFWSWGFLLFIWAIAITGLTLKTIFFNELAEWIGLMIYIGLGWLGIISGFLTHRLHGFKVIKPLLYGAFAYTIGAVMEFIRFPIIFDGVIGPHECFHIAVIAGIAWHWQFIRNFLKQPHRSDAAIQETV
ncbi:MAG: hemolysin III family protein [Gammaproteobacteria bacterium]|nr:hemolysin III family protein [Gammaproteobacteria bacterium]